MHILPCKPTLGAVLDGGYELNLEGSYRKVRVRDYMYGVTEGKVESVLLEPMTKISCNIIKRELLP